MGSWDTYCAICGGPFTAISFKRYRPNITVRQDGGQNGQQAEQNDAEQEEEEEEEEEQQQQQQQEDFDGESSLDSDDEDFEADEEDSLMGSDSDDGSSDEGSEHDPIELSDTDDDNVGPEEMQIDTEGLLSDAEEQETQEGGGQEENYDLDPQELADLMSSANADYPDTASDMNDNERFGGYVTESSDRGGIWGDREEANYDPDVIRPRDTKWKNALYVLGYNPESTDTSKCFLSGRGRSNEYGTADVWPGLRGRRDPNYPRAKGKRLPMDWITLYKHYAGDDDDDDERRRRVHFPVHMPCLELFCKHVTSISSPYKNRKFDKDALYLAMYALVEGNSSGLMIGYGAAESGQEQYWRSARGMEHVVAHPRINRDQPVVLALLRSTIETAEPRKFVENDLSEKVQHDPFSQLPWDLIYRISYLLGDSSLLNLASASWHIHCHLRGNNKFWRHRLRKISMPWFDEVFPILSDKELMHREKDWKAVLCELNKVVLGPEGKKGALMGIFNRRRIWGICKVLGREYYRMVEEREVNGSEKIHKKLKEMEERCDGTA
ncbi:hypothetical protein QBC43DRAFT_94864 [Cladorrhinum sp. PSN259]|nr:hypothetical protein QBC43DRAFT_94864 [Cladorrhinum sp. PSN259]